MSYRRSFTNDEHKVGWDNQTFNKRSNLRMPAFSRRPYLSSKAKSTNQIIIMPIKDWLSDNCSMMNWGKKLPSNLLWSRKHNLWTS